MQLKAIPNEELTVIYNNQIIDNIGISIVTENINLIDISLIEYSMFIFIVRGKHINGKTNTFECKLQCNWNGETWELISILELNINQDVMLDYVIRKYDNKSQAETIYNKVMQMIPTNVMEMIQQFNDIYDEQHKLTSKNMLFNDNEISVKKVRKTSEGYHCKILVKNSMGKLTNLYGLFIIEKHKSEHFPLVLNTVFKLDSFHYDEINISLVNFIDKYGSTFRSFLNEYVKYNRII